MTTTFNPSLSPVRSPATRRAMTHVTSFIREAWIVPMVVMGGVLCGVCSPCSHTCLVTRDKKRRPLFNRAASFKAA